MPPADLRPRTRPRTRRPAAALALAALAALAAGCGVGGDDDARSAAPRTKPSAKPSAAATSAPPAPCQEDASQFYQPALLDAQAIWPDTRIEETSGPVVELDAEACAAEAERKGMDGAKAPEAGSCDPARFPWVSSQAAVNHELAAAGVHRWGQITIKASGNLAWEFVVAPAEKDADVLTGAYRKHLLGCHAQVLASDGGEPVRFLLDGRLMVGFHDGMVIALQGQGPDWNSDMAPVMKFAEDRAEKFLRY